MNNLERTLKYLLEARRNPELNPKISAYEELKPYRDKDGYFFSFTEQDKIGVNPRSPYATPIGIYTYPTKGAFKRYNLDGYRDVKHTLPFASERKYVWIVKLKEGQRVLNFSRYGEADFQRDASILKRYYNTNKELFDESKLGGKIKTIEPSLVGKDNPYSTMEEMFKYFTPSKDNSHGFCIWQISREIASSFKQGRPSVKWNTLLYKILGYTAILDLEGRGIIHPNEPMQAVFLTRSALSVVKQVHNKSYTHQLHWFNEGKKEGSVRTKGESIRIYNSTRSLSWQGGTWLGGTWKGGVWKDGDWHDGVWEKGTWYKGLWKGGIWEKGIWQDGTWLSGHWRDGSWHNGTWRGGDFNGGFWKDGTWESGNWNNGFWSKGTWKGGIFRRGGWYGGVWEDGFWSADGKDWQGGEWKGGWILDIHKKGNYKPNWEWNNKGYVRSPIDPYQYFTGRKRKPFEEPAKKKEDPPF